MASNTPPLKEINDWLTTRLEQISTATGNDLGPLPPSGNHKSTSELQAGFVEKQLRAIRKKLRLQNVNVKLLSLRSSYQKSNQYLRPIHSEPARLGDWMADWRDQQPFKIALNGPNDSFEGAQERSSDEDLNAYGIAWGLFDLESVQSCEIPAPSEDAPAKFALRIKSLLARLKGHTEPDIANKVRELAELPMGTCCIVYAKLEERNGEHSIQHLLAVYVKRSVAHPISSKELRSSVQEAAHLFDGLTLIRNIDSSLFRSDAARMVVHLTREFDRPELAPADKISFAIENVRRLLDLHMVGRPLAAHNQPMPAEQQRSDLLSVFYVSISFRERDKQYMPHTEIYPHVYRGKHPTSAFMMSHERVPTISKFLLHNYLSDDSIRVISNAEYLKARKAKTEPVPIKVHHHFADLFQSSEMQDALDQDSNLHAAIFRSPDQLHLTSRQGSDPAGLWDELNLIVDRTSEPNKSLVAFVVEGNRIPDLPAAGDKPTFRLPRGIIAIESARIDAFSDEDIDNLRELASGLATLVRRIGHDNGMMDYENRMRTGFSRYRSDMLGETPLAQVLYEVMRIDAKLLEAICEDFKNPSNFTNPDRLKEQIGIPLNIASDIFNQHSKILIPVPDSRVNTEPQFEAGNLLKERQTLFDDNIPHLREFYSQIPDDKLRNFLAACPSNMAWGGYLTSVATAIGDRALEQMPELSPIATGFSADAIFMASVGNELRQVVKFSTAEKLLRERDNYRRFVRYRLPFAGRIPVTSFAFEGTGEIGFWSASESQGKWGVDVNLRTNKLAENGNITYERQCFGALVSDLVEGGNRQREEVITLQDIIAAELNEPLTPHGKKATTRMADYLEALTHHFGVGTHLWRLPKEGLERERWKLEFQENGSDNGYPPTVKLAMMFMRFLQRGKGDNQNMPLFPHLFKRKELEDDLARIMLSVGQETLASLNAELGIFRSRKKIDYLPTTGLTDIADTLEFAVRQDMKSPDALKFDLSKVKVEDFAAISHGDLNPNNLAWAHAFGRFFAIDFENTGHGFVGTDHLKLMVSTLVGTLEKSASVLNLRADDKAEAYMKSVVDEVMVGLRMIDVTADAIASSAIENGMYWDFTKQMSERSIIGSIFSTLLGQLSTSLGSQEEARNRDRNRVKSKKQATGSTEADFLRPENRDMFGYLLFATAAKEWSYSLRSMRESTAQLIVDELGAQELDLRVAMLSLLKRTDYGTSRNLGQRRQVLDACRFLLSWCAVLATFPTQFGGEGARVPNDLQH